MRTVIRLFLVVFCLALVACSSKKQVSQSDTKTEVLKERIVTYKDTVLTAPESKATIKVAVNDLQADLLTPKHYFEKQGNASAEVRVQNGQMTVTAKCDSIALRAKIKQELLKESTTTKTEKSSEKKTGISTFKYYCGIAIGLLVGIILGFIFNPLIKTIIKLLI